MAKTSLTEILDRATKRDLPPLTKQEFEMKVSLTDRERTHGIYKDTAGLSQCIKDILRSGNNWSKLSDSQKEALEMLSVKLARILNGNPNFNDHWDDIVGYGQLGADSIKPTMPNITANLTSLMTQQQAEPVQQ